MGGCNESDEIEPSAFAGGFSRHENQGEALVRTAGSSKRKPPKSAPVRPEERGDSDPIALPAKPAADHPHAWLVEAIKRRQLEGHLFRLVRYSNPTQDDDPEDGSPTSTEYHHTVFSGRQILDGAAWTYASEPSRIVDIGLNSLVVTPDGERLHVGMADFAIDPDGPPPTTGKRLSEMLQWYPCSAGGLALYHSGRSLHAYFDPSPESEYVERLATLLLLNTKDARIIDDRWVAHKLIEGSSVLRWTANQSRYLAIPKRWEPPEHSFWS